ncbi:hypothetical protein [Methanococcus voltae]|uniref:Resolvase helix-turn-helix domain protein n=1 Tax=Methanococcus voltae (strain ATCC BAA-1334 / A3) TaxID=456320 RepID=D7DRA6_METV3|nr:hypothetical protein [Methanococcus voltae]MCS3901043.1 hypothetical protein [Methanococcus voltae]
MNELNELKNPDKIDGKNNNTKNNNNNNNKDSNTENSITEIIKADNETQDNLSDLCVLEDIKTLKSKYKVYKTSKYLTKKDINNIIEKDYDEIIMPQSIYKLLNEKNKSSMEKLRLCGIIVKTTDNVGRPKKITKYDKDKIKELLVDGKSVRKTAEIMDMKKTTVWENIKDCMNEIKIEKFRKMIYEYKELLIMQERYGSYVESLFLELDIYINNEDMENALEILNKIIIYVKSEDKKD